MHRLDLPSPHGQLWLAGLAGEDALADQVALGLSDVLQSNASCALAAQLQRA